MLFEVLFLLARSVQVKKLRLMASDKPGKDPDWLRVQEELTCFMCRELYSVACKRNTIERSVSVIHVSINND